MAFEQVLCLCLRFSNNRVCLLCSVARLEVYWQYWFFGLHSKLKGLMMMWQASFDLEKQQWELTVHPSGCYTLLGKMLSIPLPETWMLSPAFPLRTIVSKYSCASAIFSCDLNFRNIYMDAVHLSRTTTWSSLQAWLESTLLIQQLQPILPHIFRTDGEMWIWFGSCLWSRFML